LSGSLSESTTIENDPRSFRLELMAALEQARAQIDVIFDDAVMDHRNRSRLMGMRVGFRRPSMRRPARMAYPDMAGERRGQQQLAQIIELADRAPNFELLAVRNRRDPG
jgi:hypothetical protein